MSDTLTLDTPVNVKVQGEKAMRKNVVLVKHDDEGKVRVKTGLRGRPATLNVDAIQKITVLKVTKPEPKAAKAKDDAEQN